MPIILRGHQRALTSHSPGPDQGRWVIPSHSRGVFIQPFFTFGVTSDAVTANTFTVDMAASYEYRLKFRLDESPLTVNQVLVQQANGANMRIRINTGGNLELTVFNDTIIFDAIFPLEAQAYQMSILIDAGIGADNAHCTLEGLAGAVNQSQTISGGTHPAPTPALLQWSNQPAGTADFIGAMVNFEIYEAGVLAYNWPMNEGFDSNVFIETEIGGSQFDATLTQGDGVWSDAP